MILSLAFSISTMVTRRLLDRAANNAASLTKFARSAPEKPGVPLAITEALTLSSIGTFCMWTRNISSLPLISGNGTTT